MQILSMVAIKDVPILMDFNIIINIRKVNNVAMIIAIAIAMIIIIIIVMIATIIIITIILENK